MSDILFRFSRQPICVYIKYIITTLLLRLMSENSWKSFNVMYESHLSLCYYLAYLRVDQ